MLRDVVTVENYRSQAGYTEVSSQVPALIAAGSAVLLSELPFELLLGSGATLAFLAARLTTGIPEHMDSPSAGSGDNQVAGNRGYFNGAREFFMYIRSRYPQVLLVYLIGFPFVFTVAGNFVKPVFIANTLHGDPSFLAFSEAEYAAFAMVVGLLTPTLQRRLGDAVALLLLFSAYTSASIVMPMYPSYIVFSTCQAIHGLGNPGSRVVRKAVVLRSVERGELGRFNGWVSLLFTLTRVALIGASTIMIGLGVRNVMVGFALIQAALTLLYTLALLRVSAAKKLFLLEPSWID
ncbi:hypothetical protein B9Q04_14840 [Candidatus Marsarchaeota G2 archaeon BE_D]|uniref:Major facilitator superfamily (MFS) profile domain-containing protein n=1 Tax=Candidatus Marsarchaeota G2 archaeon BE_D TaxID=1978158 RepID=A0A2R6C735_9ARCH|nr:MAG: hypothetical protein B9Q04_14840 [Candidatus Marsarchaeota G2 archaeon BE_D]